MEFVDVLGRKLVLGEYPQRIISLVPSITETLFAFGLSGEVIAITDYCTYPRSGLETKERIGGTKTLKLEKILSLKPDLILANLEENRKRQVESLINQGLNVYLTFPKTVEDAINTMRELAKITGTVMKAEAVIRPVDATYRVLIKKPRRQRARVLCLIWKKPYMSFNADTFVSDLIQTAGGENVFAHRQERYFRFELKELPRLSPDVILLPTEPYLFTQDDVEAFKDLAVPAVENKHVYVVDGELVTWHGPRLAQALTLLHGIFSQGTGS